MSPRVPERPRRLIRWVVSGALISLAPKCVLCVAAYFGLGTTLGLTSAEICGGPDSATPHRIVWLLAGGVALGVTGFFVVARCRIHATLTPSASKSPE